MRQAYTPPKVDFKKRRKSVCIPDQSMTIQEIVKRYVRGVPVDVVQRKGVYVDQVDDDLEKIARMDFAQKADYARYKAEQAAQIEDDFKQAQAERSEAQAKQKASEEAAKAGQGGQKPGAPAPEA